MDRPSPDISPDAIDIFCYGCTYDLRGLGPGLCPECGRAFDPDKQCEELAGLKARTERSLRELALVVLWVQVGVLLAGMLSAFGAVAAGVGGLVVLTFAVVGLGVVVLQADEMSTVWSLQHRRRIAWESRWRVFLGYIVGNFFLFAYLAVSLGGLVYLIGWIGGRTIVATVN